MRTPASTFRVFRVSIVVFLLAAAFAGLPSPPDPAQAAQTAVTTANLNLRQQPSTSSSILLVIPAGATVEITGAQIGAWYPVVYNDTPGYVHGSYLELSPPELSPGASARVRVALSLRAGPGTSYARLAVMPIGAVVTLTGESENGFWQLTYNGTMGWSASQYLTLIGGTPIPTPTSTPVVTVIPSATSTPSGTSTAKAQTIARLNLRSGAGTNFPVITIIPEGATVELLGQTMSGFQQVRYGGYTGWAYGSYLQPLTGKSLTAITTANVNLRQGPETAQGILLVIPVGTEVALTGASASGYHQVRYNGVTGWVASAYLTGTGAPPDSAPLEVPILMYHAIASTNGPYQITEQTLRNEIAWLASNGYQSITPDDIMAYLNAGTPLPAKPIMITIDDGNASDVLFKQILDQYGFAGVWYLTGSTSLPYSEATIRAMDGAGQVCGHTVNHLDLSYESYSTQLSEIRTNKLFLERVVGHPINCFAYPYGAYNQTTMRIITDLGFTNAVDAWGGPLKFTAQLDRYHLTRINLAGTYSLSEFIGLVS